MGAPCGGWGRSGCGLGPAWPRAASCGERATARTPARAGAASDAGGLRRFPRPGLPAPSLSRRLLCPHGAVVRADGRGRHWPGQSLQELGSSSRTSWGPPAPKQVPGAGRGSVRARGSPFSLSFLESLLVQGHVCGQAGGRGPGRRGQVRLRGIGGGRALASLRSARCSRAEADFAGPTGTGRPGVFLSSFLCPPPPRGLEEARPVSVAPPELLQAVQGAVDAETCCACRPGPHEPESGRMATAVGGFPRPVASLLPKAPARRGGI